MSRQSLLGNKEEKIRHYGTTENTKTENSVSDGMKTANALFRSICNQIFCFPSFKFNNISVNTLIRDHKLESLMSEYLKLNSKLLEKSELLPYVSDELSEKKLRLDNLTEMGLKLNEGTFYNAIATAMETMLNEKLENIDAESKSLS